ncbi:uncharacterized protein LOC144441069 [Glandiceps talaboti]
MRNVSVPILLDIKNRATSRYIAPWTYTMATQSSYATEQDNLMQQRRRTNIENKHRSWHQLKQEFQKINDIINIDVSSTVRDLNEQQRARTSIFEQRQKLIDIVSVCSEVRRAQTALLDVLKPLTTLSKLQNQSMDEFVEEIFVSDYREVFHDAGVMAIADFEKIDMAHVFQPKMKPAPYKRLQQRLTQISSAREYMAERFDADVQTAVRSIKANLRKINTELSRSFNTLTKMSIDMEKMGHSRGLAVFDVIGFTAIVTSGLVAYVYYDFTLPPLVFLATTLMFRRQALNVLRWLCSTDERDGLTRPEAPQIETHQMSIIIKFWTDSLGAELGHFVDVLTAVKERVMSEHGDGGSQLEQQIKHAESEMKDFLDMNEFEDELRKLCHKKQ